MGSGCGFIIRLPLSGVFSAGLTLLQILLPSGLSGSAFNLNPTTLLQSVYHYHGQTSYFSSCRHSGYGLGTGFLQRVSKVKALSVAITLQLTNLYYQRCSELDVNNQVPHHYFRFGHPCASAFDHNDFQSHDFVDEEDLFVRDLDAFDNLEARELLQIVEAESVLFYLSTISAH